MEKATVITEQSRANSKKIQINGDRNNSGHNGKRIFVTDKHVEVKLTPEVVDVFNKLKSWEEVFSFSKNEEIKKVENVRILTSGLNHVNANHFYALKDGPNGSYLVDVKIPEHFKCQKRINKKTVTLNVFTLPEYVGEGKEIIADVIVRKKIFLEEGNVGRSVGAAIYLDVFPKVKNGEEIKPKYELIIGAETGDPALRIPGTKKFIGVKKIAVE